MKLKKSLLALSTATAVAISGTAVAGATEEMGEKQQVETTQPQATGSSASFDKFFGLEAKDGKQVSLLDRFKAIGGIITVIVSAVGGLATLIATLSKIGKQFK